MSGWFKRTAILTNPSGVPICNFSSCLLPTKGAFSIPKIAPPAPRTTEPNLLSASIKLVVPSLPTFEPKAERTAVFHGRRVPSTAITVTARRGFYAGQCTRSTLNPSRPGSSVRSFSAGALRYSAISWSSDRAAVGEGHCRQMRPAGRRDADGPASGASQAPRRRRHAAQLSELLRTAHRAMRPSSPNSTGPMRAGRGGVSNASFRIG